MNKTTVELADGRELIYYDRGVAPIRTNPDGRDLPRLLITSEMRHDPILDEWVVIASHRQTRTFMPPANQCPLCPSSAGKLTEIPASDYEIVVFENRFPSLSLGATDIDPDVEVDADLVERRPAGGRCEVVVFTSDHALSFSGLSFERARDVVDVWADRTDVLSRLPGIEQVFPFENCGVEIGVTLTHPHGQVYAFPFVTPRTERMIASARRYRDRTGGNVFADVLAAERRIGDRVIESNGTWTAFVPPAARWPVEVHLYPHRRIPDLTELNGVERDDFTALYLSTLRRFDALYDAPMPYIAAWHQAPVHRDRDLAYLHMELFSIRRAADKLKYLASTESGMASWINDMTPEGIAALLRGTPS